MSLIWAYEGRKPERMYGNFEPSMKNLDISHERRLPWVACVEYLQNSDKNDAGIGNAVLPPCLEVAGSLRPNTFYSSRCVRCAVMDSTNRLARRREGRYSNGDKQESFPNELYNSGGPHD